MGIITQEKKKELIRDIALEKMRDYRQYNFKLPGIIKVKVNQGCIKTDMYDLNLKAHYDGKKIIIRTTRDILGKESKKRMIADLNNHITKVINIEDKFELTIQTMDYSQLPDLLRKFILDYALLDDIKDEIIVDAINKTSKSLHEAYKDSYDFNSNTVVRYYFNTSLEKIFSFHNNKEDFTKYVLEKTKMLNIEDYSNLLNISQLANNSKNCKFTQTMVEQYINSLSIGTFKSIPKQECLCAIYNNKVISSV